MEHLTKLLRDSYDLQESKPNESAYWHLQKLRSEIKQLTLTDVVKQSEQFNCYEMHAYSRFAGCNKQCKECAVNEKSKAI